MRTQEELAEQRADALSRANGLADRERELDEIEDLAAPARTDRSSQSSKSRLRRLESTGTVSSDETQSFAGGLETLRRRGTKRPPGQ